MRPRSATMLLAVLQRHHRPSRSLAGRLAEAGPDEDDVVGRRRAIQAVDAQADRSAIECPAVDLPPRVGIHQREPGLGEAPVRQPERDRIIRRRHVHHDRADRPGTGDSPRPGPIVQTGSSRASKSGPREAIAVRSRSEQSRSAAPDRCAASLVSRGGLARRVVPAADRPDNDQDPPDPPPPVRSMTSPTSWRFRSLPPCRAGIRA